MTTLCLFGSYCVAEDAESRPFAGSLTEANVDAMQSFDFIGVILKEDKNLQDWADELEKTEPKTPQDVWITYRVCLRAGRDETVCKMVAVHGDSGFYPEIDLSSTDKKE